MQRTIDGIQIQVSEEIPEEEKSTAAICSKWSWKLTGSM